MRPRRPAHARAVLLPALLAAGLAAGCGEGGRGSYRPLPPLDVTYLDGQPADLAQFRGRVVVLNLWATWCIPCRDEMPELEEMQARYPSDDFTVVGISIDEGDVALVEGFLNEFGITYPNFMGDGPALTELLDLYPGVPHTLLVDREGLIRAYWGGRFHPFEPETEALVERVLAAAE
ncbi:TlpA family protein disulfide reductase [Candidatus Palauibacter sp.]|uniref:TlpA family protein disulfide reductase n=1 Tax=Candidatus Palauibacter sp. TaxID=3101350 RepID=UPI003C70451A